MYRLGKLLLAGVVGLAPMLGAQAPGGETWVGTWACSQLIPGTGNALPSADLTDATLRQTVHVSVGGAAVRVRFSNVFGTRPLHILAAHVARSVSSGTSAIVAGSDRPLLFNGSPDVLIPPGTDYLSDPLAYPVAPLSNLSVSMHVESEPGQQTGHPGSRQTTFYAHGDLTAAAEMPGAGQIAHWYMLSGVDVTAPRNAYSIVALGDSITDGYNSTPNGNDRWPNALAQRLGAVPGLRTVGVLDQGIDGNRLLTDEVGPNSLARFDRDVLGSTGVRTLVVLEGINDLGGLGRLPNTTPPMHAELVHRMIGAYRQIIARAHAHGITVYGATITPDTGAGYFHPDAVSEADRQQVNAWIRTPGHFDAVIDLDKITADPADPRRLLPAYDSGDHLHPGPAGYRAMGDAVAHAILSSGVASY